MERKKKRKRRKKREETQRISERHRSRTSLGRRIYLGLIGAVAAVISVLFVLEVASGYVNEGFPSDTRGQAYRLYEAGRSLRVSQDGGPRVQAPAPPAEHVGELSSASFTKWLEHLRSRHRDLLELRSRAYRSGRSNRSIVNDLERVAWIEGSKIPSLVHEVAGAEFEERVAMALLRLRLLESGLYWTLPANLGERELRWLHHSYAPLELELLGEAESAGGAPVQLYLAIDAPSWSPRDEARAKLSRASDALIRGVLERFNARPLAARRRDIRAYDAARTASRRDDDYEYGPMRQFYSQHPTFRLLQGNARIDRERSLFEMRY